MVFLQLLQYSKAKSGWDLTNLKSLDSVTLGQVNQSKHHVGIYLTLSALAVMVVQLYQEHSLLPTKSEFQFLQLEVNKKIKCEDSFITFKLGIGGVHRTAETTFDISADLTELGRSGVAVISSGVKSILDIPKTLEYLVIANSNHETKSNSVFQETQGVFVATFGGGRDFPAFYSRKSGCYAPYCVENAFEAAQIIHRHRELDLQSGMLFAVPVPEKFALDENVINGVIEEALNDAKNKGVEGKEITPFLLGRIGEITEGKSLQTSILY